MNSDIFKALEENKFSYEELLKDSIISLVDKDLVDINVIIGFRGRQEFINPIIESFQKAFSKTKDKKFSLTFVEHSSSPEAKEIIGDRANYIWTKGNFYDQYNISKSNYIKNNEQLYNQYSRSLAYNFGVKYTNEAKYYLLHDIDILVKENFFDEIFLNLKSSKCMQTYGGRRVLYMSKELTEKILNKENDIDYNSFSDQTEGISLPMYNGAPALGSKGGSILVEKDFYYQIGGFDPELFWGYAAEDQIFWDKACTILGRVDYADNPPIDMFHMWHPPTSSSNPLIMFMENYMLQFRRFVKKDRIRFIELKNELLK